MPGRGTPLAQFRLRPELWEKFGEVARAAGTDRAAVLRNFIRWYIGDPDAEPPERPKPAADNSDRPK